MSSRLDRGRLWRLGAIAAATAVIINLAILGIGRAASVPFVVPTFDGTRTTVAPLVVVLTVVVWFALGLLLATFVAVRQPRRLRAIQIVAAVVTVVSLIQPLAVDTDTASRVMLGIMHPVTGAAFVLALRRVHPGTPTTRGDAPEPANTSR
jgi:hypothetical protein